MTENAWLTKASNHDANEERHYIHQGRRVCLTWSWLWLNWGLGINASIDPGSTSERASAWLLLGPLCVEIYLPRVAQDGAK